MRAWARAALALAVLFYMVFLSVECSRPQYARSERGNGTHQDTDGYTNVASAVGSQQHSTEQQTEVTKEKQGLWERPSGTDYVIAIFAFCSVVVSVFQWLIYRRQAILMRETLSETQQQAAERRIESDNQHLIATRNASAAKESADAAKRSVDIAEKTYTASYTANAEILSRMEAQLKLAREEFNSTHRPRLRVRDIAFNWQPHGMTDTTKVYFSIVNVGETTATEIEMRADLVFKEGIFWRLPPAQRFESFDASVLNDLESGFRQECFAENATQFRALTGVLRRESAIGRQALCLVGRITYKNKTGIGYCTSFVREFDIDQNTFKVSKDPEENYED